MKEIIRTCRTIHECRRCWHYIISGQRYRDSGNGTRFHIKCDRRSGTDIPFRSPDDPPRIGERLAQIGLGDRAVANIFLHSHGFGRRYLHSLNHKSLPLSEIRPEEDLDPAVHIKAGYGYTVLCSWPDFRYMGDAFGFTTPNEAASEARTHFDAVKALFQSYAEKRARPKQQKGKISNLSRAYK